MKKKNTYYLLAVLLGGFLFGMGFAITPLWAQVNSDTGFSNSPIMTRQELIDDIFRQIEELSREITKEINRISAEQKSKANSQAYSQNNNNNSSLQKSSSNSSSQSSFETNLPFGGMTTNVKKCTCSDYSLIDITPAKPDLPKQLMYNKKAITYAYYMIPQKGVYLLGTHAEDVTCYVFDGERCTPQGSGKRIVMVGTSGGSDGGGGTPPVSGKEDPPPPVVNPNQPAPSANCNQDSLGGWDFNPGIQNQIGDASQALKSMLYCMCNNLAAQNIKGLITSISDMNYIGQLNECRNGTNTTNCAHSQTSCHYGGDNRDNQSYAVDIGTSNSSAIQSAASACGAGNILNEGNHIHIATPNCRGGD